MNKFLLVILICCFSFINSDAQMLSANEVLKKSIAFHDPESNWESFADSLFFKQLRPDSTISFRKVYLNNVTKDFNFWANYEEGDLYYEIKNHKAEVLWNNSSTYSDEIKKKYKMSEERVWMYRDYYSYLYGMPMKIKDPGAILNSKVEEVNFQGKDYYRLQVNYEPEVGGDTWYFYFDKSTYALEIYQFFHDESKNDGEYILLKNNINIGGLYIPAERSWYMNEDDRFLGTDILKLRK